ncbi:MAG: hypothetical protein WBE13_20805 [Candidatus Acidiferrum sp.]
MLRLEIVGKAFADCFHNGRLWLIQFFANPILFVLFAAWLLIPVSGRLPLVYNFVFAVVLIAATLFLHAGTLNSFAEHNRTEFTPLWPAFRRALRHLLAVAVCVAVFYLLWLLVAQLEAHQANLPAYVRSTFPVFVRRHIALPELDTLFAAAIFVARWVLAPGLLLPFLLQVAGRGFRGFGVQGFFTWRKAFFSLSYWLVLLFAALLGVLATQKLMDWTPDFRTSTFHSEAVSLAWRLFVSYAFGLFSWMLACSVVGRCCAAAGICSDVSRNPAA